MKKAVIILEGPDKLEIFKDLVNLYDKPNIKKSIILSNNKGTAFLISPDLSIEIKTR